MNQFLKSIFVLFATITVFFSPGKIKTVVNYHTEDSNVIV